VVVQKGGMSSGWGEVQRCDCAVDTKQHLVKSSIRACSVSGPPGPPHMCILALHAI
jgi:hypothetical protein